jgi:winged helix DNA-binding protein
VVLSRRARNRALLARQRLLTRTADLTPAQSVEHLLGLQAQAIQPPYYALWSRLENFDPHELGRLLTDREAVRMTLMRGTVHLVTVDDALLLRPLVQNVIERGFNGAFRRRVENVDRAEFARAVRELLEGSDDALTGRQIAQHLIGLGLGGDPEAVRWLVGVHVALVQVPPRGVWGAAGQARYVTLESWTGREQRPDPSLEDVIVRYLRAFGPASAMDFQKWSGLTRCKPALDRLRPRLKSFHDEQGKELFDLPDAPRPDPETKAPVRLLGEFDNVLLSHADRRHVVPGGELPWMNTITGNRHVNTALVDGMLRAIWWIERNGKNATLAIRPTDRLSAGERKQLRDEARRMIEFAAPEAQTKDVRLDSG